MTLSISLVCSRSQNIALSEPSVWRNIYVGEGCSPDINTALVYLYSKCSVKGPLRVAANVTGEDEGYRYDPALWAQIKTLGFGGGCSNCPFDWAIMSGGTDASRDPIRIDHFSALSSPLANQFIHVRRPHTSLLGVSEDLDAL
ncbi:uncharacterized protein BT62DRAFT_936754 [Guyanagaster necrorhizus]|uniref:Uncharacterized protein n=1 Tax=Guyanagaster necrorhizus TaxID=856835 RepID=A0A9P7VIT7_9AGAR|nr:uncharacterized protein BT62DRAFT_936754 [Guyanagaster necrorhizus MCA 3950]KAG7441871.1 hypothetical protein BT62DRAFT_936754 [Guyanagaster necrorhizus MCA 3950]